MSRLNRNQLLQVLREAGVTDEITMRRIMEIVERESRGDPSAVGPGGIGLCAVDERHVERLRRAGIIQYRTDLFDPVTNVEAWRWLGGGGALWTVTAC